STQRFDLIALRADRGLHAHLLGDAVAKAPEVDDVTSGAKRRGGLDQGDVVAGAPHPVGERGSGYAGAADGYFHMWFLLFRVLGDSRPLRYAGFVRNARCAKSMIAVLVTASVCGLRQS